MITPRFKLEQDENTLIITILAPYTNVKDTEIHVLENDFRFHSAPYYLRLTLPGHVDEGDNSSAKYYTDQNAFIVTLDKVTPGEFFPDLEMLTKFLDAKSDSTLANKIEVLPSGEGGSNTEEKIDGDEWFIEQSTDVEMNPVVDTLLNRFRYGFANNHIGLESKYEVELSEVAEIKNPDSIAPAMRKIKREETEMTKFSDDHYFADFAQKEQTEALLKYKFKCRKGLTDKHREQLKNLSNKEFLLDKPWQKRVYCGLVDILFSYLYDMRMYEGSHCVESAWNISRVSATLSWFEVFDNINDVVYACIRRSLCYPFYRNWDLALKAFADTIAVLKADTTVVLKCFLDIAELFREKPPYYLLNQLYIEDYCVWIQKMSAENVKTMTIALEKAVSEVDKEKVGFDLVILETAAKLALEEEMEEELSQDIAQVHL